MGRIIIGDNLSFLQTLSVESIDLIYIDPPFNTGKRQKRARKGSLTALSGVSFSDSYTDFGEFLCPRLREAYRVLSPTGSMFVHLDQREGHYCKVWMDGIFGRSSFIAEIIWAYDYGGRSRRRWPAKHDTILWYAKDARNYTYNVEVAERACRKHPEFLGAEEATDEQEPSDVWWHTIVPTNGSEKTGYPTQKPLGIIERIVQVHSNPGDLLLDFFAGSGTLGLAAARNGRDFICVDNNPEAGAIMRKRLEEYQPDYTEVAEHERSG